MRCTADDIESNSRVIDLTQEYCLSFAEGCAIKCLLDTSEGLKSDRIATAIWYLQQYLEGMAGNHISNLAKSDVRREYFRDMMSNFSEADHAPRDEWKNPLVDFPKVGTLCDYIKKGDESYYIRTGYYAFNRESQGEVFVSEKDKTHLCNTLFWRPNTQDTGR